MAQPLGFKPDFEQTAARFEAWWRNDMLDRPPVTLHVEPSRPYEGPPDQQHPSARDRWFDTEFIVDRAIADMARRDYPGDSIPLFNPNMGPDISATPFGCDLEYSDDSSWSVPIIQDASQWPRVWDIELDFDNPHWRHVEKLQDTAIAKCDGRYLVGMTDLHGNYDILAALRDPQMLCVDMLDCPEVIHRTALHVAEAFNRMFRRQYGQVSAAGFGSTCWTPMHHDGPAYVPSCDFWCMVSDEMAGDLVLPAIEKEMEPLDRSVFHLDGPQALRHLDLLLDLPQLDAVQWVYGAGNGPAAKWIEVYQRCQAAGKSVQVLAEGPEDALAVLGQLKPQGVWLCVKEGFADADAAEAFCQTVRGHRR